MLSVLGPGTSISSYLHTAALTYGPKLIVSPAQNVLFWYSGSTVFWHANFHAVLHAEFAVCCGVHCLLQKNADIASFCCIYTRFKVFNVPCHQ